MKAALTVLLFTTMSLPQTQSDGAAIIPADAAPVAIVQDSGARSQGIAAKPLAFELVSIRKSAQGGKPLIEATDDSWTMTSLPLFRAIQAAYMPTTGEQAFRRDEIEGLPNWATDDNYDIVARIPDSALEAWRLPDRRPAMVHAMLQQMLVERCRLTLHHSSKQSSILVLTMVKRGTELTPAEPNTDRPEGATRVAQDDNGRAIHVYNAPSALLAKLFSEVANLRVDDRTGLTGRYDVVMHLPNLPTATSNNTSAQPDRETMAIDSAAEMGLKLAPAKGPVQMLVIDHIERPSDN